MEVSGLPPSGLQPCIIQAPSSTPYTTSTSSRTAPASTTTITSPNLSSSSPAIPPTTSTAPSTLPTMLTLPNPTTQRQTADARRALVASLSNMLDSELQERAQLLHSNEAAITKQRRELTKATANLKSENAKMAQLANQTSRKVLELGAVQNWAERMERDFAVLEETMRLVHCGEGRGSRRGSGSESGSRTWSGSWSGSESGSERLIGDGLDTHAADEVGVRDVSEPTAPAVSRGLGVDIEDDIYGNSDAVDVDPAQVPLPPDDDTMSYG